MICSQCKGDLTAHSVGKISYTLAGPTIQLICEPAPGGEREDVAIDRPTTSRATESPRVRVRVKDGR